MGITAKAAQLTRHIRSPARMKLHIFLVAVLALGGMSVPLREAADEELMDPDCVEEDGTIQEPESILDIKPGHMIPNQMLQQELDYENDAVDEFAQDEDCEEEEMADYEPDMGFDAGHVDPDAMIQMDDGEEVDENCEEVEGDAADYEVEDSRSDEWAHGYVEPNRAIQKQIDESIGDAQPLTDEECEEEE